MQASVRTFQPKQSLLIICLMAILVGIGGKSWGQVSITNTTAVTQNFDGMGSSLALPANWKIAANGATPTYAGASTSVTQQASSGAPATGGTYNWGSSATERAVGSLTSGGFASPNSLLSFYQNNGSAAISSVSVSYVGERYRINTAVASIQFYYSLNGTSWTAVTTGDIAATSFPTGASNYGFPLTTVPVSAFTVTFSTPIAISGNFYLRWNINTTGASSQGIGIDDVSVTATFASAAPTVTNGVATAVSTNSATLNGSINANGNTTTASFFSYGTTTSYGTNVNTTPTSVSGTTATSVVALTAPLAATNTLYHYNLTATNAGGTVSGTDATFTTVSLPPTSPTAGSPTTTGFTAGWTAPTGQGTEAFTYTVLIFSDADFTTQVGPAITNIAGTSTVITGLSPNTTYYYSVKVVNAGGSSTYANYTPGITTAANTSPPVVTSASPTGIYGTAFTYSIQATNTPTNYAVTSGSLPAGLTLNATTGVISGTPTAVVTSSVVGISATNSGGTGTGTLTFTIAPKVLTITGLTAANKVYDANITATLTGTATLNGIVNGDNVTLTGTPSATFADASVGTGKPVTVTGYTLGGTSAGNYTVTQPTGLSANITAKALTVIGLTANNKVYDGTTTATLTGTATLNGVVGTDNVTLSGTPTAIFTTGGASVGTGKTVTVTGYALSGTAASNYTITQPIGFTADITAKPLTITGITINNKTYDGTATATISGTATLNGVVSADAANVTLGGTPSATFTDANVGTAKPVTVAGYTISGSAISNYTLSQPSGLTADITQGSCTTTTTASLLYNFTGATTGAASNTVSNVTAANATRGNNNGTSTLIDATSVSSGYTGASGTNNIGASVINGAFNATTSTYFEIALTPASGYSVSVTGIKFGSRSTGTGAAVYTIRSSADGYATNLATGALSTSSSWALVTPSIATTTSAVGTAITYRIYGSGGSGSVSSTVNWRVDDITLTLAVNQPQSLTSPTTASTCSGALFTYTPTSGLSGATYPWTRAAVAGISNAAGSGTGNISETLVNTTASPVNVVYNYTITTANCISPNQTVTVTVNPSPNVTNFATSATSPANAGAQSIVTISSTTLANGTYTVTFNLSGANTATGSTASVPFNAGTGNFLSGALVNPGATTVTITSISNGTCPSALTTNNTATINVVTPAITTGTIAGSPFCVGASTTVPVSVPFTSVGIYNGGNVYTAQLSNASGSFASPVNIGTITSTANSGTISAAIPAGTTAGANYRIRVVSNSPVVTGADNGTDIIISSQVTPAVSLAADHSGTICAGTSIIFTATPTNGGTTPNYDFKVNGTSVQTGVSNTYTTSSLTNGQTVTVTLTSDITCVTSSTATSTGITVSIISNAVPSVTIAANPSGTICAGTSVTFTATPTNGGTTPNYDFRVNGVSVQSGTSNTYTTTSLADGNTVDVVLTSTLTCTTTPTANSSVITMSVTTPVTPSVAIAATPGTTVCAGTSVSFAATPTNGGTTPTYQWFKNGTQVATGATYNAGVLNNGDQVYVVLTTSETCYTSLTATSTTITETVNPQATITLSSGNGTTNQSVIQGNAITDITYTIAGSGTGATVTGLPAGVTFGYNAGTLTITGTPTVAGIFPYTATTTSTVNCDNSATGTITVCAIPTQDTGIVFTGVTSTGLTASWTVGDGTGRVVIINTANSFTNPTNSATLPTANPAYNGSGQQVVYNGTGNTVTVTGLDAGTTYWLRVYAYNSCSGTYIYDTAAVANKHNPNSRATSAAPLTQSNFISVLTPQYTSSGANTRMPVMFRATITGLRPNTQYRYYTTASLASGFGTTNSGAGSPLLVNSSGTSYVYNSNASVTNAGQYDSLVTNASGSYTGWFGFVNTTNAAFTAGNYIYPTITLGTTAGNTVFRRALNDSLKVLSFSSTALAPNGGSFLKSKTNATPKNLVALFDNTNATGRPLAITPVEYIANTGIGFGTTRPTLYDSSNGAWNAIIPNNNANGVQAIEQLSVTTGSLVGCIATDADGQWATGRVKTSNPVNGSTTALVIATADDPLATCPVYPTIAVQQGATQYANNSTYTYANTPVGANKDVTFTISNTGSGPLTISGITVSGAAYSLQGTAPTTVAANGTATFVVRFNPTAATTYTGAISINSNDTAQVNVPYILNVSGTGINVPVIAVDQNGTAIANNGTYSYTNTVVGDNNDVTFTINNTGLATLNISSIAVTGAAYSLQGTAPTSVPAGGSATFIVRFSPTSVATFTGIVTINSDDPNQPAYKINLSGKGTNVSITTGTISGSPYCVSTTDVAVSVPFTYTPASSFTGNFVAQLSDASGNFTNLVDIGTIASDGTGSQTIAAAIPSGTTAGTGYRIRVRSNSPSVIGSISTSVLVVSNPVTPSLSIAANPAGTVCAGSSVTFTATPVNGGTPTYQWYLNSVLVSGVTGSTYTSSSFINGDQVYVVMTTSLTCVTTSTATSNTVALAVRIPSTISLSSAAGTNAQTVTQGVTINDITYAIGGGASSATVTGLPAGLTTNYSNGVFTITGAPTATGTFNYIVKATGGCGNNPTVTGTVTVIAARIVIADNSPQVAIKNITVGSVKNPLSTFTITNNLAASTTLTQVKAPLTSNYKAADITNFKLYSSTTNNLSTVTTPLATQSSTSTGTGETITFTLNQALSVNTTYYYWITADINSGAQTGDSIIASAIPATNFTFSGSPLVSGSVTKAGAQIIASGAITPGLLTVLRLGNGLVTPDATALDVNLYQYNTSGTGQNGVLLKTLPSAVTTAPGIDRALTQSATAVSEGALNLSVNGRLLTMVGYNAARGAANVATGTADVVIGRVDAFLKTSTVTSFQRSTTYTGVNLRSAVTIDGKQYWTSGPNSSGSINTGGIRYILDSVSSGTGTQINGANTRVANIFNGQLYASAASGTNLGVNTVGTGLPTTAAALTILNGVNTADGAYGFLFLNSNPSSPQPDLLYITGTSSTRANNGIYKYYFDGTSWVAKGHVFGTTANGTAFYGITGTVDASGNVVLYTTSATTNTSNAKPTQLIKYLDNALPSANITLSAGTVLGSSGTMYTFGGVAFAPTANGDTTITSATTQLTGVYRNITVASGGSAVLTGNVQVIGSVNVQAGGTLDCGAYTVTSFSPDFRTYFSVDSAATLITSNPAGIDSVHAIGSIQTSVFNNATTGLSSRRNFSSGANYIFTAPIAQGTGIGLPKTVNGNVTINSTDSVSFANRNQVINGTLTLTKGKLALRATDSLTLGGAVTHTNGSISSNATATLILNGSAAKALYFTLPGNILRNLTVNTTATNVSLDNALDITSGINYGIVTCDGNLQTNGNLTLKSDFNGTASVGTSTGTIQGNVTVERFTSASATAGSSRRAWRLFTSPVSGISIHNAWQEGGINTNTFGTLITGEGFADSITAAGKGYDYVGYGNHTSIRQYNSVINNWEILPATGNGTFSNVTSQQAFMLFIRGDRMTKALGQSSVANIRAIGSLKQGPQSVTIQTGNAFTLVGNPYASTIDFNSIYTNNIGKIQKKFYAWNSKIAGFGAYLLVDYNTTSGKYQVTPKPFTPNTGIVNDDARYISSNTAFFVTPVDNTISGTVDMVESDKKPANQPPSATSPFREVPVPSNTKELLMNLNLKDSDTSATLADGFRVRFDDAFIGNEEESSSLKAWNFNENLNLVRNGKSYIIEAHADVQKADTVFVQMWNVTKRAYQLQIEGENFVSAPGVRAWLEDNYLNTKEEVALNGDITTVNFIVNADSGSSKSDRFRIVFQNNTAVLPVTLTSVKAAAENGGVNVSWTVTNEVNVKGYTIEKSPDGRTFTSVSTQQAARNNPQVALTNYSGYDATPKGGDNYYRIRIEGNDGKVSYSEIVKVTVGANGTGIQITLYPNPVREGKANLVLTNLKEGAYLVSVFSGSGQTVYQKKVTVTLAGTTQSEQLLLGNSIAQGSYQIRVADSKGVILFTDKLIVGR